MKVVSDTGLMHVFQVRANDFQWKKVSSITVNAKAKIGCGFPFNIHFYAKIEEQLTQDTKIVYDYESFESDVELIKTNPERYCLK